MFNELYALCKISAESHAPGIQKLTNESARVKSGTSWVWPRVRQVNASAISTENTSR